MKMKLTAGQAAAAIKKEQKPWGIAGDDKSVTRTVTLTMTDNMRFTPDKLSFKQGETVRFVIRNQGKLLHELVIGTKARPRRACRDDGEVSGHGA
jgi:uncharacterized cupredoxin-like copper-binding protein